MINPESAAEIDAARAALALIDAALDGDGSGAWFIAAEWSERGEVLLRQLLAVAESSTRRIGELTGTDPRAIVQAMRDGIAAAEAIAHGGD